MVMQGYLDDPEATAEAIDADGWLHTGDIGTVDEAGNMRITDRLKDMYVSGGFNVYPAEVEAELGRHDDVVEAAVVGMPDARMGEVGRAFVVPAPAARRTPTSWSPSCGRGWRTSSCRAGWSSSPTSPQRRPQGAQGRARARP